MYTAENHEKEVAAATENAFTEGKNAAIDEKQELAPNDGLPAIASGAAALTPQPEKAPTYGGKFLKDTGI
jgi:hypothetical protein